MLGGFAGALIFISLMVLLIMLGAIVVVKLVHGFQVVVTGTAAGAEKVAWPDEPLFDTFPGVFPLLFVIGVWVVPTHLALRAVAATLEPAPAVAPADDSGRPGVAAPAEEAPNRRRPPLRVWLPLAGDFAVLWLALPVGLLSSFSSVSPWVPLRPAMLGQLIWSAPAWIFYYPLAGACLAVGAGTAWLLLFSGQPLWIPFAAPVVAGAWLVYARLLGRLARLLRPTDREKSARPTKGKRRRRLRVTVTDPWAPPMTDEDQYLASRTPHEEAYDIQTQPPAPTPRPRRQPEPDDEEAEPYEMETPPPPQADDEPILSSRPTRPREPIAPATLESLWTGVFGFPWQEGVRGAWVWLSVGLGVWAFLFQMALAIKPG
jgi:hypothetical protein